MMSINYDPPTSVAFESGLSWILKENVLVKWQDTSTGRELYLGQCTPTKKEVPLTLWVGRNEGHDLLVVMLQFTASYYVKERKKSVTMFLLPVQDVRMDSCEGFPSIALRDLESPVCDQMKESYPDMSDEKRFLHLRMHQTSSRVVMPARNTPTSPMGTASHLILLLRSLSKATTFDAYMNYSSFAKTALTCASTALALGQSIPAINLRRMYDSNGGLFNAWEHYLPQHDAKDNSDSRHSSKHKRKRHTSPGDVPPPPYAAKPGHCRPEHELGLTPSYLVEVPESDHSHASEKLDSASVRDVVPESPVDFLQDVTSTSAHIHPPATRPFQMQNSSQHVQSQHLVTCNNPAKAARTEVLVGGDAPALLLPALPLSKDRAPYCLSHFPLDSAYRPINRQADVSSVLRRSLTNWLYEMKKMNSNMHERPEIFSFLMALGIVAQQGDVEKFVKIKAKCMATVLEENTNKVSDSRPVPVVPPKRRVQTLIQWLCGCILDIETVMIDDLKTLSRTADAWTRRMQDVSDGESLPEDERRPGNALDEAEEAYMFQEAVCISNFCVMFGQVVRIYGKR
ncbi:hypothetical protein BDV97DRAFT_229805 [Delphinella strobiligena]|nr:hypothetical protein BDV97DRAFT_229805 [Delphinella strobiligena]